ncbi:MAG: AEC family transporter [Desulfobulbaceae bacterium]|nr:AEC family transporter [Desulfobulbaceae bacterium]
MERVLPFLILLIVGNIMRRIGVFPRDTAQSLNLYVIYVALPALILIQVPRLSVSGNLLIPVLMPWLVVLFSGILVRLTSLVLHWPREITGALLLMVPLGNTAFFGIPMVELFYGNEGVPYAILYDQFGSFLALSTYGTLVIAFYSGGGRPGWKKILGKIVFFPPFIALVTALFLKPGIFPGWLNDMLEMTSVSLVPVVMVAIGFQLHLSMPSSERLPLLIGLVFRLIVTPLVFLLGCMLFGLSDPGTRIAIFETAMPPMVAAAALASIAGLQPRLTAAMVGFGILLSFVTLPGIHYLIELALTG